MSGAELISKMGEGWTLYHSEVVYEGKNEDINAFVNENFNFEAWKYLEFIPNTKRLIISKPHYVDVIRILSQVSQKIKLCISFTEYDLLRQKFPLKGEISLSAAGIVISGDYELKIKDSHVEVHSEYESL